MFMLLMTIVCYMLGYMLLAVVTVFPILRLVFMDWIATFFFIIPIVMVFYRMSVARTWQQTDRIPTWKQLINYLRRDGEVIPLIGKRAYMGESFLDVPELGLVEFLGKESVYHWGDKKVCWGLENINYTADPRYFNLTALFYKLGFKNSDDLRNVLLGKNLYLMGKVYINMVEWDNGHGTKKLVKELKEYDGEIVDFKPVETPLDVIHNKLDKIRKR